MQWRHVAESEEQWFGPTGIHSGAADIISQKEALFIQYNGGDWAD